MAARLDGSMVERLWFIFGLFDEDGSGRLEHRELVAMACVLIKLAVAATNQLSSRSTAPNPASRGSCSTASAHSAALASPAATRRWTLPPRPPSAHRASVRQEASEGARSGPSRRDAANRWPALRRSASTVAATWQLPDMVGVMHHDAVSKEAQRLLQRLLWMDLDGDRCLSFSEWCQGAFANAQILRCFEASIFDASSLVLLDDTPEQGAVPPAGPAVAWQQLVSAWSESSQRFVSALALRFAPLPLWRDQARQNWLKVRRAMRNLLSLKVGGMRLSVRKLPHGLPPHPALLRE